MDEYNAKNLTITWGGSPVAIVNNAEVKLIPEEKKMDTKTLKAMADRLQELADGAEPMDACDGVCLEIRNTFGQDYLEHAQRLFRNWPEHSGIDEYPVKHPSKKDAKGAYFREDDLWSGEYGAARRRLCGFLAQEIRKEIGDETN